MSEWRNDFDKRHWYPARNSGAAIPAFSFVRVREVGTVNSSLYLDISTSSSQSNTIAFVGNVGIPSGTLAAAYGLVSMESPAWVRYDPNEGTPAVGEIWKPGSGVNSGALVKGSASYPDSQYVVIGGVNTTEYRMFVAILPVTEAATSTMKWGVAKTNWIEPLVGETYVWVEQCDDALGTNPETGTYTEVVLPRHSEGDPNVVAGDVIAYQETVKRNGSVSTTKYVCCSAYMDSKIKTVTQWVGEVANIRPGWALMDGTANTDGSGINMTDIFPRGGLSPGTSGGSNTHIHTGATANTATTSITVDDHPDHIHPLPESGTPAAGSDSHSGATDKIRTCTEGPHEELDCNTPMTLDHTVNDSGHDHTVTIPSGPNVPAHKQLIFIERIDNSSPDQTPV
jgi:hypothetical protein